MNGQRCILCDEPAEQEVCYECWQSILYSWDDDWDSESEDLDACFRSKQQAKLTEGFQIMKGAD